MQKLLFVVTAHSEGQLLIRSIENAIQIQNELGGTAEVTPLVTIDSADELTSEIALSSGIEVITFNFRDVGAVRNWILRNLSAEYEATVFLDGDDTTDSKWLKSAIRFVGSARQPLLASPKSRVVHYQGVIGRNITFRQPNAADKTKFWLSLISITNLWHSCVLFNSKAAEILSYPLENQGVLFEDWALNRHAISLRIPHLSFGGKVHYYRREKSRLRLHQEKFEYSLSSVARILNFIRKIAAGLILLSMIRGFGRA